MRIRNMLSVLADSVSGSKVYWMKGRDGHLSVCASVSGKTEQAEGEGSKHLAARAERLVVSGARKARLASIETGVLMGGDGNGRIVATAIADIPPMPGIESRLVGAGIAQLR
jgi:hypothetical protein